MVSFPVLTPAIPEIALALSGMGLLLLGAFWGAKQARLMAVLAIAVLLIVAVLTLSGAGDDERVVTFGGQFVVDRFSVFMKILVLISATMSLMVSIDYLDQLDINKFEYPVLIIFSTLGMMMMISSDDLISLYVGIEIQSLSLYVLASFHRDLAKSSEAGLKYFVLGSLSSGILLYGCSLIYGFSGTTKFEELIVFFQESHYLSFGMLIGLVFVMCGIAFKISAVPFHMWAPDVYEGSPTPVTAFFATAPKVAALGLLVRVLVEPFGTLSDQWQQIIYALSVASMILGSFAAIGQTSLKRLMAYSSIGNIGYALMGLVAVDSDGIRSALIYMSVYVFVTMGAFSVILSINFNNQTFDKLDDLKGLAKTRPGLAIAMAIFMFSLAGIPPLAGFFSKLCVFLSAIQSGYIILALIGALTSVVSAFYYLRIVKLMYFDSPINTFDQPTGLPIATVVAGTGIFTALFFAFQAAVTNGAGMAAAALVGK